MTSSAGRPLGPRRAAALLSSAAFVALAGLAAGGTAAHAATGPAFVNRAISAPGDDFQAGSTYFASLAFKNTGDANAEGSILWLHTTRGLGLYGYDNCRYQKTDTGSLLQQGTTAYCWFPGTFEAGKAYELTSKVGVSSEKFAAYDIFGYKFSAGDSARFDSLTAGFLKGNSGESLKLAEGADTGTYSTYAAEADFPTGKRVDLALSGATVKGKAGDTVKADVVLTNKGPGWFAAIRSGGEPITFSVQAPSGAEVTKAPKECFTATLDEGADGYICNVKTPFLENASVTLPFELTLDKALDGARGKVYLPTYGSDPDLSNNTAWIVVDAEGGSSEGGNGGGSGGTTPGGGTEDGGKGGHDGQDGQGGGGSGAGDAGNGAQGGGAGTGDAQGGSGNNASPQGGTDKPADTDGNLAHTGADGVMVAGGAGAVLVALGAGVFLVRRRMTGSSDA